MIEVRCRTCKRDMSRVQRGSAHFWHCAGCGAHALSESTLRKIVPPSVWTAIWPAIREAATKGVRECPSCGEAMDETRELGEAAAMRVDFCDRCRLVWLDPEELDPLPKVPLAKVPPRLSPSAARLLAQAIAAEYDAREERIFGPFKDIFWALVADIRRRGWYR